MAGVCHWDCRLCPWEIAHPGQSLLSLGTFSLEKGSRPGGRSIHVPPITTDRKVRHSIPREESEPPNSCGPHTGVPAISSPLGHLSFLLGGMGFPKAFWEQPLSPQKFSIPCPSHTQS